MDSGEDKCKTESLVSRGHTLLDEIKLLKEMQDHTGERKLINSELWYACAGPFVTLPQVGSLVNYFPQGTVNSSQTLYIEKLIQQLDVVFSERIGENNERDVFPILDFGLKPNKYPTDFFCKTLTASDTSTHGHPKRHLLTIGWSMFVGVKCLRAGDSVLFIRDEKSQLLLGVRWANCQQTSLTSSVLSADSMYIGVLAAAAHATANRSTFTIFYNPRAYDRAATKFRRLYANINFNFGYYHDDLKQDLNLRNVASSTHCLMIQQLDMLLTLPHGIKIVFLETIVQLITG
ncbi:hypothetical protein BC332_08044 [Capsicum chinense]|nr:hypothetical protein BC332_08044 [Capsicum chinense]